MAHLSSDGLMPVSLTPELLDLLPAAAYVCDAEGFVRYYNPRAAELWGREPRPANGSAARTASSSPTALGFRTTNARWPWPSGPASRSETSRPSSSGRMAPVWRHW